MHDQQNEGHTGRANCCVVCAVDDFFQWLDDAAARRLRVKSERSVELSAMWIDFGGEG